MMALDVVSLETFRERKHDRRSETEELRMELHAHKAEELVFIRRVQNDATRVFRLIEGGLLVEAHFTLGDLLHTAGRRERQVTTPDGAA